MSVLGVQFKGRITVSKTADVGSIPTTPAKSDETTPVSWTEICYNEMGVLLYEIFDEREIKDS